MERLCTDCGKEPALERRKVCGSCKERRRSPRRYVRVVDLAAGSSPAESTVRRDVLPVPALLPLLVAIADAHIPDHDRPAWRATLSFLSAQVVRELVILGDFLELGSVSEHGGCADEGALLADLEAGRLALRELRTAVGPDCRIVYLEGNHETRLARFVEHRAAPLVGAISLPEALGLAALGIAWVPERQQPIVRGNLRLLHGHQDLRLPPKYHAGKMADVRGRAGATVVYGHTHRPQQIARLGDEPALAVGLGCLRTLAPDWERGRASGWAHGFGAAYLRPDGSADLYAIPIRNGGIAWAGRLYGGAVP